VPTVQGELESALSRLFQREVVIFAAGRTDAGVHALGQVVNTYDAPDDIDTIKVRDSINSMCGPHIAVSMCSIAADDFHARHSARSRTYAYALLEGNVPDPFLAATALYHPESLDVDAMNEACGHVLGERDFSSFGRVEVGASPLRNLYEFHVARTGRVIRVRARANGFLQQMVRSLVGTIITVGEGRRSPDEMLDVLKAKDRAAAGPVAPPHGLCLVSVEYDAGWSRPFAPLG